MGACCQAECQRRTWDLSNLPFFSFFSVVLLVLGGNTGFLWHFDTSSSSQVTRLLPPASSILLRSWGTWQSKGLWGAGEQFSSCWQPSAWSLPFILGMAQVLQQHCPLQITAGSSCPYIKKKKTTGATVVTGDTKKTRPDTRMKHWIVSVQPSFNGSWLLLLMSS